MPLVVSATFSELPYGGASSLGAFGEAFASADGNKILHTIGHFLMLIADMTPKWLTLNPRNDARGRLVAVEGGLDVPFAIKRIYTLQSFAPGTLRGGHAHKTLSQALICLVGSCSIELQDGCTTERLNLHDPARALLLAPMIWHTLRDFSPDCVLLVIASEHYDEGDYIRDYDDFIQQVRAFKHDPDSLSRS